MSIVRDLHALFLKVLMPTTKGTRHPFVNIEYLSELRNWDIDTSKSTPLYSTMLKTNVVSYEENTKV